MHKFCLSVTYLKIMAISTPRVATAPKYVHIPPKTTDPNSFTMIMSRRTPYANKKTANINKQIVMIVMTARILKMPVFTET